MLREYRTIEEVAGPLMLVRNVENVKYGELGEIELTSGELRRCRVLEINRDEALVQLFESSAGINAGESKVRFLGRGIELSVSMDMLGRVFSGMGNPIDNGPDIIILTFIISYSFAKRYPTSGSTPKTLYFSRLTKEIMKLSASFSYTKKLPLAL